MTKTLKKKRLRSERVPETTPGRAAQPASAARGEYDSETDTDGASGGLLSTPVSADTRTENDAGCDADGLQTICEGLQVHGRFRRDAIRMRVKIENGITATVAKYFNYEAKLSEKERKELWGKAERLVAACARKESLSGEDVIIYARCGGLIEPAIFAIESYDRVAAGHAKEMESLAKKLPVATWVRGVRGFGLLNLGLIIGECGNLSRYPMPSCLVKRMGCAPYMGKMGSSWRNGRGGGLDAKEWTEAAYSPQRRSIAFLLGESLLKLNDGIYREIYDKAKAGKLALEDERWPKIRCHRHAHLLMTKRALIELWAAWNGKTREERCEIEVRHAR